MSDTQWGSLLVGCIGALLLALTGPLYWAVTRSAARGGLEPNWAVGLRTPSTLYSQKTWQAGHRAALPWARATAVWTVACGIALIVSQAALARSGGTSGVLYTVLFFCLVLGVFTGVIVGKNVAARATWEACNAE